MSTSPPYDRNDPQQIKNLLDECVAPADRDALDQAYRLADRVHSGQWRKTAQGAPAIPYIVHPLRTALIVTAEWERGDRRALAACLLHDVLEDAPETQCIALAKEIRAIAGVEVEDAVWTLTRPAPSAGEVKIARDARYFSELRGAPDWVRTIKCADRVDNLRDARAWGDAKFWERYSSETIGWHLYLARETAPIMEVALFDALVDGERTIRGRVPVWADGHLIDPVAAALVPEDISRRYRCIGLALRGETLVVGLCDPTERGASEAIREATGRTILSALVSAEAVHDAQAARLFG